MIYKVFNCLLLFLVSSHLVLSEHLYVYETKYMDMPLEHIPAVATPQTFKLRYLISLKFFKKGGPIFVYTGGNHDITNYAENNGFVSDAAMTFNGAVLFIEHRYYGKSLPFGNASFSSITNLQYLSTYQALSDFAYVICKIKKELVKDSEDLATTSPVIAFGGNYAGMMAAYLHMKYPHVAQGAIVSAPGLLAYPKLVSCHGFYDRVTSVYEEYGTEQCVKTIKLGWDIIIQISKTNLGMDFITTSWKLCKKLSTSEDVDRLIEWLTDIYTSMTIVNYHTPSTYLGPLPAYPVKVFCEKLTTAGFNDTKSFIETFGSALEIYTNYTGNKFCHNYYSSYTDFNEIAFKYQSCTELITPRCSTEQDMFVTKPWNQDHYLTNCFNRFGVKPVLPDWGTTNYGGNDMRHYPQMIVTSNPHDPMSYETPDYKNSLYEEGVTTFYNFSDYSSMVDLRETNQADNNLIMQTKSFYISAIKKWINNV